MTKDEIQKVRDELVFYAIPLRSESFAEVMAILDAELAKPEPEPVVYWNGDRSVIPADDVSYFPNWTDYYPTPLYRHPAPQSQPVARVTGYYAGRCVIEPLDGKSVFPAGMAVYSAPVAAQSAEPMYFGLTHDGTWLSITQAQYEKLKPEGRLKVYADPQPREWKSLTDDEIDQCIDAAGRSYHRHKRTAGGQQLSPADAFDSHLVWTVQAALKAKNTEKSNGTL